MSKVILTVAPPGGGKSTLAQKYVLQDFVQIERDQLRMEMFGVWYGRRVDEGAVTKQHTKRLIEAIRDGRDVIISDTNINPITRNNLIKLAESLGADCELVFPDSHLLLDGYLTRNKKRIDQTKVVPDHVVEQMYVSYREQFPLPAPMHSATKQDAFIFDIDGTVADMEGIRGPFDWGKVDRDKPHTDVIDLLKILQASGKKLIAVSGRDSICRKKTEAWLLNNGLDYFSLFMRPEGSQVKDSAVKHDLYHKYIAPHFNIHGVFDDRDQVVRTWRAMGLRCYQVAPGNF